MNRTRRISRVLAMVMAILLVLGSTALGESEGSKGICYRVTGGKNEMVILGSIHIGNETMYPLSAGLQSALKEADTLIFECDTNSAAALKATLSMMVYPKDETIKDHLSAESFALLEQAMEKMGLSIGSFLIYRPWALTSIFALNTTALEMGVEDITKASALGVEEQIIEMTKNDGKNFGYLETAELQLRMMDDFSPELQEYMLRSTCEELLADPSEITANSEIKYWPEWWRIGDAQAFADSYLLSQEEDPEPELTKEYHDGLVTNRNVGMAEGLRELLESDEKHSYFVTVGLLHLVLPQDSVVYNLEQMGYTVERME